MKRSRRRTKPKKLEVPMGATDWDSIEALRVLLGERTYANTARRAIAAERARREREESERLAAAVDRKELLQRLGESLP